MDKYSKQMENKKQEVIRKAYGKFWDKVNHSIDENGWCIMYDENSNLVSPCFLDLGMSRPFIDENIESGNFSEERKLKWRPKSLHNLENNNGWISINNVEDLPKEGERCIYHIMVNNQTDGYAIYNYTLKSFCQIGTSLVISYVTHYQPIVKPLFPIY